MTACGHRNPSLDRHDCGAAGLAKSQGWAAEFKLAPLAALRSVAKLGNDRGHNDQSEQGKKK